MPLLFTTLILPPTALDITPAWTAATHSGDDCNTEGEQDESEELFLGFFCQPKDFAGTSATESRLNLQPTADKV